MPPLVAVGHATIPIPDALPDMLRILGFARFGAMPHLKACAPSPLQGKARNQIERLYVTFYCGVILPDTAASVEAVVY